MINQVTQEILMQVPEKLQKTYGKNYSQMFTKKNEKSYSSVQSALVNNVDKCKRKLPFVDKKTSKSLNGLFEEFADQIKIYDTTDTSEMHKLVLSKIALCAKDKNERDLALNELALNGYTADAKAIQAAKISAILGYCLDVKDLDNDFIGKGDMARLLSSGELAKYKSIKQAKSEINPKHNILDIDGMKDDKNIDNNMEANMKKTSSFIDRTFSFLEDNLPKGMDKYDMIFVDGEPVKNVLSKQLAKTAPQDRKNLMDNALLKAISSDKKSVECIRMNSNGDISPLLAVKTNGSTELNQKNASMANNVLNFLLGHEKNDFDIEEATFQENFKLKNEKAISEARNAIARKEFLKRLEEARDMVEELGCEKYEATKECLKSFEEELFADKNLDLSFLGLENNEESRLGLGLMATLSAGKSLEQATQLGGKDDISAQLNTAIQNKDKDYFLELFKKGYEELNKSDILEQFAGGLYVAMAQGAKSTMLSSMGKSLQKMFANEPEQISKIGWGSKELANMERGVKNSTIITDAVASIAKATGTGLLNKNVNPAQQKEVLKLALKANIVYQQNDQFIKKPSEIDIFSKFEEVEEKADLLCNSMVKVNKDFYKRIQGHIRGEGTQAPMVFEDNTLTVIGNDYGAQLKLNVSREDKTRFANGVESRQKISLKEEINKHKKAPQLSADPQKKMEKGLEVGKEKEQSPVVQRNENE